MELNPNTTKVTNNLKIHNPWTYEKSSIGGGGRDRHRDRDKKKKTENIVSI